MGRNPKVLTGDTAMIYHQMMQLYLSGMWLLNGGIHLTGEHPVEIIQLSRMNLETSSEMESLSSYYVV